MELPKIPPSQLNIRNLFLLEAFGTEWQSEAIRIQSGMLIALDDSLKNPSYFQLVFHLTHLNRKYKNNI